MEPMISIVIPVYNGANYMREAIDSALAQTYENFEVIVVNDGSDDNGETEKIALSYGNKIRYFKKENGGVATALNFAISKMHGEYFSWLSHDDFYYPNNLECKMDYLKKQCDYKRIIVTDFDLMEQKTGIKSLFTATSYYEIPVLENSVFSVLQGVVGGCTMLIHKSHFERVGTFDESLITTQDYDLWFRMLRGQKILYIPQALMVTRVHDKQGSVTIACHNEEKEKLHIGFIDALTTGEIIAMYGSKYHFYRSMCILCSIGNMPKTLTYVKNLLHAESLSEDFIEKTKHMKQYLAKLSNGKAKKLCVFGAGKWGKRLLFELKSLSIKADCFCDNDMNKHGMHLEDTICISPDELMSQKEEVLVIVSVRAYQAIIEQLSSLKFPYVVLNQSVIQKIYNS